MPRSRYHDPRTARLAAYGRMNGYDLEIQSLEIPVPVHGFDPGATVARVPKVASREPITTPQRLAVRPMAEAGSVRGRLVLP
jgi:hypothetical protein